MSVITIINTDTIQGLEEEKLQEFVESVIEMTDYHRPMLMSLNFVSEDEISDLNREFRNKTGPTDILSFVMDNNDNFSNQDYTEEDGDIIICYEQLKKNASKLNITLNEELKRLIIHGILHLQGQEHSGYDYSRGMLKYQEELLKQMKEFRLIKENND